MKSIFSGYTKDESKRIKVALGNLQACSKPNAITYVGSLPIRYYFELLDIPYKKGDLKDLDILIPSLSSFNENLADKFVIYHTHNYPNYKKEDFSFKFFLAMIDKETKIMIDVFSDFPFKPLKTIDYNQDGISIKLQSAEDQLITQVLEAEIIMLDKENGRLDYKRRNTIAGLKKVVNMDLAEKYWLKRDIKSEDRSLNNALTKIESHIEKNGKSVLKYLKQKKAKPCSVCVDIKGIPLSSPEIANKYLF